MVCEWYVYDVCNTFGICFECWPMCVYLIRRAVRAFPHTFFSSICEFDPTGRVSCYPHNKIDRQRAKNRKKEKKRGITIPFSFVRTFSLFAEDRKPLM